LDVYLHDTYAGGYTNFNRYYFAQVDKLAAIIDERYNEGGDIADYVIDYLRRPLLSYWNMREGKDITTPIEAIFGPKVMIMNEMAGSGGDALPWTFRKTGGRKAHLGRPGWPLHQSWRLAGRWLYGYAELGVLQPQRNLGRGESRGLAGYGSGI